MPTNPFQCGTSSQYFTRIDHLGRPALTILVATCAPTPKRSHTVALSATSGSVYALTYCPDIQLSMTPTETRPPLSDDAPRVIERQSARLRPTRAVPRIISAAMMTSPAVDVNGRGPAVICPLDLCMINLNFLESYNARAPFEYEAATASTLAPSVEAAENAVTQADHAAREERLCSAPDGGLFLCPKIMAMLNTSLRNLDMGPGPDNCLDLASQDKILSIVLSQMPLPFSLNAASFPSPELLDRLILYFLSVSFSSAGAWIYRSTFIPKQSRSEFVLAMAAAGAVLTPDSALRKLGFAMQEVVRHRLPAIFEADNTLIRDFGLHQHGGPDAHEPPQVENIVHCSETA
ncbi:hypothetical protein N7534_009629 [Penicillium rubens]|nr:hypothetical protein N7534_009629 [Penicillium rubens]